MIRYCALAAFLLATPAFGQVTTTNCNTIDGRSVNCTSRTQQPYQPPQPYPMTQLDVGSILRSMPQRSAPLPRYETQPAEPTPPSIDTQPLRKRPTGREFYIGCNLLKAGTSIDGRLLYSGSYCATMIQVAIDHNAEADVGYCIPPFIMEQARDKIADQFDSFYEQYASDTIISDGDGPTVFFAAMKAKWPCAK